MTKFADCTRLQRWLAFIDDEQECVRTNKIRHKLNLCKDSSETIDKIDEFDEKTYKFSNEVPTNKSFYDMGLCQYQNAYLDENQDGRYLREYCVQRAGSNHFLHLRTLTDLRSQNQHTDPEALMTIFVNISPDEHLNDRSELPYDIAYKWAQANKSMGTDRKMFLKMLHTEMKYMCIRCRIAYIEKLEQMADDMEDVTVTWVNYINSDDIEKEYLNQYMQTLSEFAEDEESWEYWDEIIEPLVTGDGLDRKDSTNPYSTNRLYNGTESLTPEFQSYIENADIQTIKKLQSRMFPQKRTWAEIQAIKVDFEERYGTTPQMRSSNPRKRPLWKKGKPVYDEHDDVLMIPAVSTGLYYKPPYYHYFTPGMVSHFWSLIKLRKQEINKEVVDDDDLSADALMALQWIKQLGKGQITTMLINNAIKGNKFNLYGIKVNFNHQLDQKEANTLWQQYKSM